MAEKMLAVSEKTLLPLSLVIGIMGGSSWLTTIYVQNKAHAGMIEEIKVRQDAYTQTLQKIDARLSRIEGKLGLNE